MIVWASGFGMRVGRFSRPVRGVGVITMPDVGLDTMRNVEVPPGAGELQLCVPGVEVGVFIHRRRESDGLEVTHSLKSPTRELLNQDGRVEF
jgi:hypothetical protein